MVTSACNGVLVGTRLRVHTERVGASNAAMDG